MKCEEISFIKWFRAWLLDWALIILTFGSFYQLNFAWWAWFPFLLIMGGLQHRVGILAHEGAHGLIARSSFWNDFWATWGCFVPLGMSFQGYKRFHSKHHAFVGTDTDPERIHTQDLKLGQWEIPIAPLTLGRYILTDFLGGGIPHLAKAAQLTQPSSWQEAIKVPIFHTLLFFLFYIHGLWWITPLWFLSLVTGFWVWFRLRMFTEHVLAQGQTTTNKLKLKGWENALAFFLLPHNTWEHDKHHHNSQIPYYNLTLYRSNSGDNLTLNLKDLWKNHTRRDNASYT